MKGTTSTFVAYIGVALLSCASAGEGGEPLPPWALGPFAKLEKPVLSPNPAARFHCPVLAKEVRWEEQNVYNPAAVVKDGKVWLLYRADDKCWWKFRNEDQAASRIGLAWSEDGRRFTRHLTPVVFPDKDAFTKYEWPGGCQDVHVVEGEDGVYYMNYTAWGEGGVDSMCVATSKDLVHWQKHGPAFAKLAPRAVRGSRSGVVVTRKAGERLLPVKINGQYLMYYTHPCALAVSDNLIDWKPLGKSVWPGGRHEAGAIALWREDGILLFFNGQDWGGANLPRGSWTLGQALIDHGNLTTVLRHQERPFLQPEFDWETKGYCPVPATVANALVSFKGEWLLYYGAADRHIGLATCRAAAVNRSTEGNARSNVATILASARAAPADCSGLALWYDKPAGQWMEALPVGNGRLGCMVFGGVDAERLQLNEVSLWSGSPQDSDNPDALAALPEVRRLLFDGKYNQAKDLSAKTLICKGVGTRGANSANDPFGCFQTLGDLVLKFDAPGPISDYCRSLDLETAVAAVSYRLGDATFKREVFSSAPDQVMVLRMTCDTPGKIGFTASLTRPERFTTAAAGSDGLVMSGQLNDGLSGANGMKYIARVKAVADGGTMNTDGNSLRVKGADSVTLLLTAGTDYKPNPPYHGNPHEKVTAEQLAAAAAKPYDELRKAHVADSQKLFPRVSLDLGGHEARKLPTDQRLARMAKDKTPDPDLEAMLFQFGRYLAISSSRPDNLLSSLQGVWADGIQTPWCDQYTVDLNVQMNCWPLEVANLSECFLPTFDLIDSWRVPGAKTAKVHYNSKGWIVHTVANVWGFTSAPEHPSFGMYMGTGAWLCQPVWEHYAFTGDREYLRRAFPVMKESAEFYLDWLVKHPKTGKLISGPSTSPENEYIAADGQRGWLCMGPSMDQQQIWDLFGNDIEAAKELGIDDAFVARVRDARGQLAGPRIGSDGRLMEWPDEFKDSENGGHRHLSHLFGLFPGSQITPRTTPELAAAARKSLEVRLANGSSQVGWSSAWTINLFARLLDGEKAYEYVLHHMNRLTAPNLFDQVSHRGVFMIDGNFGYTAGVCEMLLQSHAGEIHLLPALPKAWPAGRVTGLRARGGFTVDIEWKDGKAISWRISSPKPRKVQVRVNGKVLTVTAENSGETAGNTRRSMKGD